MNTYLEGRIFSHDGRSYLVIEDNDWSGRTLKVKTLDRHRALKEFPVTTVMQQTTQSSSAR